MPIEATPDRYLRLPEVTVAGDERPTRSPPRKRVTPQSLAESILICTLGIDVLTIRTSLKIVDAVVSQYEKSPTIPSPKTIEGYDHLAAALDGR